jgi:hypothetical protein
MREFKTENKKEKDNQKNGEGAYLAMQPTRAAQQPVQDWPKNQPE